MSQFRFLQQLGAAPESDEEEADTSLGIVDENRLKQELENKRGNLFADGKNIDLSKAEQSYLDYIKQLQSPNAYPEREDTREEGLSQPWYSPDELLAGAAAPGLSKGVSSASKMLAPEVKAAYLAGKNALTSGEGILGNEIGATGANIRPKMPKANAPKSSDYSKIKTNTSKYSDINPKRNLIDPNLPTGSNNNQIDRIDFMKKLDHYNTMRNSFRGNVVPVEITDMYDGAVEDLYEAGHKLGLNIDQINQLTPPKWDNSLPKKKYFKQ